MTGPSSANDTQIRQSSWKRKNIQSDFASLIQDVRQNRKRAKEVHLNTSSTVPNEGPIDFTSSTEQFAAAMNDSDTSDDDDTSDAQVKGVSKKKKSPTHKLLLNFLNDASSEGESDDEDSLGNFSDVVSPKITKTIKQKI